MAPFLPTSVPRLHHLRSLERVTHIPHIPHTCARFITTGRPRVPSFFPPPPPARRRLEPAPPSASGSDGTDTRPASNGSPRRRPINRQIPFSHVYVLDPTTGKLSASKHRLQDLLAAPPARFQPPPPQQQQESRGGSGSVVIELVASSPEPVVRVTTRNEVEARYRAMRRASSARAGAAPKEVRLPWGVAHGDWEHKIRKARRELEKGYPVAVVVAMKRRQRPSNRQELVAFADEISQALSGAGEECKEREITERSMILSFRKVGAEGDAS